MRERELLRQWPYLRFLRMHLFLGLLVAWGISMSLQPARAQAVEAGYRDFSFSQNAPEPTADKPQSKLWWNAGSWWGSLYNTNSAAYEIHRLDRATQTWISTGAVIDARAGVHMDTLWDGQKLYVVSGSTTLPGLLYRFGYDTVSGRYALDSGFPVTVRPGSAETVALAKDSTGQLWITYKKNSKIWVNRSLGSDNLWGKPFVLPVSGVDVYSDDISSIIAFGGDRIGVLWSNQREKRFVFAVHLDAAPDDSWQASETALPGPGQDPLLPWADDHIHLATDASGRVYAAVKTSLNDLPDRDPNAPLVMLLVRQPSGAWAGHTFGKIRDSHTQPIVRIDEEHSQLYLFATAPRTGGAIYYKSAPLSAIGFDTGRGAPFIKSANDPAINSVTSTKQNVNSLTGLVALASDSTSLYYLHNDLDLANPAPLTLTPVADAYVRDGSYADTNFGTARTLYVKTSATVGFNRDVHFKFDLARVTTITRATLRVYAALNTSAAVTMSAWSVPNASWTESTLTWNNRPPLGAVLSSVSITGTTYGWYEIDISSYVQTEKAAGRNVVALALHNTVASSPTISLHSKEAANPPQLVIRADGR